jgi:hypothetical protein
MWVSDSDDDRYYLARPHGGERLEAWQGKEIVRPRSFCVGTDVGRICIYDTDADLALAADDAGVSALVSDPFDHRLARALGKLVAVAPDDLGDVLVAVAPDQPDMRDVDQTGCGLALISPSPAVEFLPVSLTHFRAPDQLALSSAA